MLSVCCREANYQEEAPFLAAISPTQDPRQAGCTGVLVRTTTFSSVLYSTVQITPSWVLSAAHCTQYLGNVRNIELMNCIVRSIRLQPGSSVARDRQRRDCVAATEKTGEDMAYNGMRLRCREVVLR